MTLPLQTPGGERWSINNVELEYSSSNPIFKHIDRPGLNVKLSTPPGTLLYPTPVGKSYTCDQEVIITMFAQVMLGKSLTNFEYSKFIENDIKGFFLGTCFYPF